MFSLLLSILLNIKYNVFKLKERAIVENDLLERFTQVTDDILDSLPGLIT